MLTAFAVYKFKMDTKIIAKIEKITVTLVLEQLGEWFWCLCIVLGGKVFISDAYQILKAFAMEIFKMAAKMATKIVTKIGT